jgi:hypothetical protein
MLTRRFWDLLNEWRVKGREMITGQRFLCGLDPASMLFGVQRWAFMVLAVRERNRA